MSLIVTDHGIYPHAHKLIYNLRKVYLSSKAVASVNYAFF